MAGSSLATSTTVPNPCLDPFFETGRHIHLHPIEDRTSLEMAISQVSNALATGQIGFRHGYAILYGLQLIANSISRREARPVLAPDPAKMVQTVVYSDDSLKLTPILTASPSIEGGPAQIRPPAEEPVIIESPVCLSTKP